MQHPLGRAFIDIFARELGIPSPIWVNISIAVKNGGLLRKWWFNCEQNGFNCEKWCFNYEKFWCSCENGDREDGGLTMNK